VYKNSERRKEKNSTGDKTKVEGRQRQGQNEVKRMQDCVKEGERREEKFFMRKMKENGGRQKDMGRQE
jgi:hypothetical protein